MVKLPRYRNSYSAGKQRREPTAGRSAKVRLSLIVGVLILPALLLLWLPLFIHIGLFHRRPAQQQQQQEAGRDSLDTTFHSQHDKRKHQQIQLQARKQKQKQNQKQMRVKQEIIVSVKNAANNQQANSIHLMEIPTEDEIVFQDLDVDASLLSKIHQLVKERPDLYAGKEQLLGMLLEMDLDIHAVDEDTWKSVPQWKDIQAVHGQEPVIHGLDTCKPYRDSIPAHRRRVGIAGMFNTGTNLLAILLQHNCGIPERIEIEGRRRGHGMEWQVPWGKHTPEYIGRLQYKVHSKRGAAFHKMEQEDIMVAAMVRHPHDWINSMCRHGYTARWRHTKLNCPNLYTGNTVMAHFGAGDTHHATIAHMWNDWNGAYFNATYPRLLVRFEDVILFPKQLTRKICACVGGQLYPPKERDGIFHYVIDSAKVGPGHGPGGHRNGLVDAFSKYGKARDFSLLSAKDLEFMNKTFDQKLMNALHWEGPPLRIPVVTITDD
jgi:hypothetical protein